MTKTNGVKPSGETIENGKCSDQGLIPAGNMQNLSLQKPSLLLHSCCGPCSSAVIEDLALEYEITVFFYNPNITDPEEYQRRKAAQKKLIQLYNENPDRPGDIQFLEGLYDRERFYEIAKGLEKEPEGGVRCHACFKLRLERTAETACLSGYDCFTTTLSVSPHKDYALISKIGRELGARYGVGFLDRDFKKNAGYQKSVMLSKKYNLYRQDHCGCEFSKGER